MVGTVGLLIRECHVVRSPSSAASAGGYRYGLSPAAPTWPSHRYRQRSSDSLSSAGSSTPLKTTATPTIVQTTTRSSSRLAAALAARAYARIAAATAPRPGSGNPAPE